MNRSPTTLIACLIAAALGLVLPAEGRTLRLQHVECTAGATVPVRVSLDDATGLAAAELQVNYDLNLLTLVSVTNFAGTLGGEFALNADEGDGVLIVRLYRDSHLSCGTGDLVTLVFAVNPGCEPGMTAPLVLAGTDMANQYGGALRWEADVLTESGGVTVAAGLAITNMLFMWQSNAGGTIAGSPCGYYPSTSSVTVAAQPDQYYHFAGWSGDTQGDTNSAQMVLGVDHARAIAANFAADMTTNTATPHWWLAQNGLTNQSFEVEAELDRDEDGLRNWQEYICGTSPNDAGDSFRFTDTRSAVPPAGTVVLEWRSASNKLYVLRVSTNLMTEFSPVTSNIPATPPMNTFTVPVNSTRSGYYQIGVR